ncbi:major capsid protein [Chromobacterium subtsugae]|uniref:major capsid protein n=1 Tax=Chromobacterium subtsugae TaxID=251747 RepID=UPI000640D43C|nr:major capsid protein [Chromobacterium subtsugae]
MASIDIFNDDAFSMASLTAAINELPHTPSRLASLGLFHEEGITTLTAQIEKDGDTLALVSAGERGVAGQVVGGSRRKMVPVNTIHLPQQSTIKADEVQGLRQFGSETELESVLGMVAKRQAKHRRQLDVTNEYHRIGAIKGQILDADGKTVLLDVYQTFGLKQRSIELDLGKDTLRMQCLDVHEAVEEALGAAPHTGVRALCGKTFWAKLQGNKAFSDSARDAALAAALRGDPRDAVEYAGIVWERFRGKVGSVGFIGDDEAYAIPEGVPELFITRYAPADHIDTVNTNGLPYYTSQEILKHGKGVEIESQSNPINLCTNPGAVIKLTAK